MVKQTIRVTSQQNSKFEAVRSIFPDSWEVKNFKCASGVSEQPYGRAEIRQGALNRLNHITTWPIISLETGIIPCGKEYHDVTCCLLRTRFGTFEAWSEPVTHDEKTIQKWLALDEDERKNTTVGSLFRPMSPSTWYGEVGSPSRAEVMAGAVNEVCRQWRVAQESMPAPVIPATLSRFKDVDFLDIQHPLVHRPRDMVNAARRLADGLLFDTVMVMDARGFLLCGEFAREEYPIVMARKPGKLPNEELTVEYKKEYGADSLCISKDAIKQGARVIVIDDLIGTGGTMRAADQMVHMAGGRVVAFLAPYAIEVNDELLGESLGPRMRFLCTQVEAVAGKTFDLDFKTAASRADLLTITPPTLRSLTITTDCVNVSWGRFRHSSNIWFDPSSIEDRKVYVFLDPSNTREMIDVLQILSILYRKDPKKIVVVVPFLEQATQDRVEFDGKMESVAAVDTLAKLINGHTVLTFDLHAEQSRFAFHDLRFDSLVAKLWHDYHLENPDAIPVFPDDGAAKRFGRLPGIDSATTVVFRKKREGDKRIVATDDDVVSNQCYVIIDDLVRSGGTMRAVAEYILKGDAHKVDALFAHAPLEPKACANLSVFSEVWTSDSCPRLVPSEWVRVQIIDMIR